jgi:hypothetical protein
MEKAPRAAEATQVGWDRWVGSRAWVGAATRKGRDSRSPCLSRLRAARGRQRAAASVGNVMREMGNRKSKGGGLCCE